MIEIPFGTASFTVRSPIGPLAPPIIASLRSAQGQEIQTPTATPSTRQGSLAQAASRGDMSVALAPLHSIAAGDYWLIDAPVRVNRVVGDVAYLLQPIRYGIPSGTLLKSAEISIALTPITSTNRGLWLEISSSSGSFSEEINVVRQPFTILIGIDDIAKQDPSFPQMADPQGAWHLLIQGAVDETRRRLMGKGIWPDLVRDREGIRQVAVLAVLARFFETIPQMDARAKIARERLAEAWADFLSSDAWIDYEESGIIKRAKKPTFLQVG
jgi:hypothetical protein